MKLLVTGDLQLSTQPRDQYRHDWMSQFIRLAGQRRPDVIIILGDLTEEKDRHPAALVNAVVRYLSSLAEIADVVGLQGNHDYVADPADGFWPFLANIPNITWITKPTAWEPRAGCKCLFLPHTRHYEDDWGERKWWDKLDWIFAHNTFTGAVGANGFQLRGIPVSVFPPGARVISGDVHKPQQVGPVTYVGSPYLCDYGDDYQPRVLLIEDDKLISLRSPGAQKRLVTINHVGDLNDAKHALGAGDIIKVRVNLTMAERDQWPVVRKSIEQWADKLGVTLDAVQPQYETNSAGRKALALQNKRSDEATLTDYARARKLSEAVLQAGLQLLTEETA